MKGARIVAWFLFAVWATWSFALAGVLGSDGARWVPDIGLVLALSVIARAEAADAPILALIAAIARAAFGPEPPIVLLAGFSGVVFMALAARSAVELTGPVWRTVVAIFIVLSFDAWLGFAHALRADTTESISLRPFTVALPVAISSGLLALLAGPLFAHLPGLTPIRRRRW